MTITLSIIVVLLLLYVRSLHFRVTAAEKAITSVRRQLIANRELVPDARPTLRNREVMQLGRDIDGEIPVSGELEIVD